MTVRQHPFHPAILLSIALDEDRVIACKARLIGERDGALARQDARSAHEIARAAHPSRPHILLFGRGLQRELHKLRREC